MNPLIIANWKMHPKTLKEAKTLAAASKKALGASKKATLALAVPSVYLPEVGKMATKSVLVGAQDVHWEAEGPYTGNTSAGMAKDAGASFTLVGHSERRQAGETEDQIAKKVGAALAAGITPILCVGERERDEHGQYLRVFAEQLLQGLREVPKGKLKEVIVAYEPVWAIGASTAMKPGDMQETALYIKKLLFEQYGKPGLSVPVLYGGSIDEKNAAEMLTEGEVQGLLVGRASVDAEQFSMLVKSVIAAR